MERGGGPGKKLEKHVQGQVLVTYHDLCFLSIHGLRK